MTGKAARLCFTPKPTQNRAGRRSVRVWVKLQRFRSPVLQQLWLCHWKGIWAKLLLDIRLVSTLISILQLCCMTRLKGYTVIYLDCWWPRYHCTISMWTAFSQGMMVLFYVYLNIKYYDGINSVNSTIGYDKWCLEQMPGYQATVIHRLSYAQLI